MSVLSSELYSMHILLNLLRTDGDFVRVGDFPKSYRQRAVGLSPVPEHSYSKASPEGLMAPAQYHPLLPHILW